jgi:hypothetical protein
MNRGAVQVDEASLSLIYATERPVDSGPAYVGPDRR